MLAVGDSSSTSRAATSCAACRSRWGGELVCLVGRNGAGKTTTFRTIMGFRKPVSGSISFDGAASAGLRPYPDRAAGHRLRAGGERGVRRPDGGREHRVPTWT